MVIMLLLVVLAIIVVLFWGIVSGFIAKSQADSLSQKLTEQTAHIFTIEKRLAVIEQHLGGERGEPATVAIPTSAPQPAVAPQQRAPAPQEAYAAPAAPTEATPAGIDAAEAAERLAAAMRARKASAAHVPSPPPPPSHSDTVSALEAAQLSKPAAPEESSEQWWAHFEEKAGKLWMAAAGVLVLFLAAGFFAKYAIERGWLGPEARCTMGALAGTALLALGEYFLVRRMRPLGQALIGGGIAIIFVSVYAAYGFYHLIPQPAAFAILVCVTAVAMTLAAVHDAALIAALAIVGGFLTPVMLSTGTDKRDALFAYVMLLDAGVLALSFVKRWRVIDSMAFVGTWALYGGWFDRFYTGAAIAPAFAWLAAFFAVFLVLPFANHLRRRTPVTVERFLMAVANAGAFFGYAYGILGESHQHALGAVALCVSACYLAMALVTRARIRDDANSVAVFVTLAIAFATAAPPLLLEADGIVIAWAIEAPLLAYLGFRFDMRVVRILATLALLLPIARFFGRHWPLHEAVTSPYTLFINAAFVTALALVAAIAAFALVHRRRAKAATLDAAVATASGIVAGFLALLMLTYEINPWLVAHQHPEAATAASHIIWSLGGVGFLAGGMLLGSLVARVTGLIPLAIGLAPALVAYGTSLDGEYVIFLNARFAACAVGVLSVFCYAAAFGTRRGATLPDRVLRIPVGVIAGYALLLALYLEIGSWYEHAQNTLHGDSIQTAMWALGALAFLAAGVSLSSVGTRMAGLAPLVVAVASSIALYRAADHAGMVLFVNALFGPALLMVLTLFAYAATLKYKVPPTENERDLARILGWLGMVMLLVLLSAENYQYFASAWPDRQKAHWVAQMSVTVVWGVYAVALLSGGFWRRRRALRLAALVLFALTSGKLLFVDIANIEQIYRIIAFFVLGVLMVGASYMYYRFERQLEEYFGAPK